MAEWKKKNTAEHTKGFREQSSVLSFRRSLRRWILDRYTKRLRTPVLIRHPFRTPRWGGKSHAIFLKNTIRDLLDHLNEGHLDSFFLLGALLFCTHSRQRNMNLDYGQILYKHTYFTVSLHDITAALINYTYRQLLQVSDTFGSLFYMYVYFVNMTINGATSSPGTGRYAWMDISPFHIFNRYLFSHTLLSADFAATFLIFMPADMFAPSSWAKTSASHLPASFE